jgi:DnaJ-domain-containing protein 1
MSLGEYAAILFGLILGYWMVSKLLSLFLAAKEHFSPRSSDSPAAREPAHWYEVLEVSSTATAADIRDAYKHMISKYHPDKVENLGRELKELAQRKSQEITAAYREGMRTRGESP